MHVENIYEVHDIFTPSHVVRVNGTEVVGLHSEVAGPAVKNHDAYPERTVTVLLPAIEVVIQYPMVSTEAQGRIQCVTVQYSVDESSSESSSDDDLID